MNFFVLPAKPIKEIDVKIVALAGKRSGFKPSKNHPWRQYKNKVKA